MNNKNPILLVLCTGNSCRSQMAEGFLRKYQGEHYEVHSAGTDPKEEVHPLAIQVMKEINIDISMQKPKALNQYLGILPVRHLLIVCDKANQTCPRIWPGTFTRTYMPFDDPAHYQGTPEAIMSKFQEVRDQIGRAMKSWTPKEEK